MKVGTTLAVTAVVSGLGYAAEAEAVAPALNGKSVNVPSITPPLSEASHSKQKVDGALITVVEGIAIAVGYGLWKVLDDDKSNGS